MSIYYSKKFKKSLRKQSISIQDVFYEKLALFRENQFQYSLNNHALSGELKGLRSFNVTGDVRVHYEEVSGDIILIDIGTHSQLY